MGISNQVLVGSKQVLFTVTATEDFEPDESFIADGYFPLKEGETIHVLEDYGESYFAYVDAYPDGGYVAACYCSSR